MARPKKLESSQMIRIVDSYFTTEAAGNPNRLKCSLLGEYAARMGYPVKAYDFQRDRQVREHMDSLKKLVQGEMGTRFLTGDSYKSLDVEELVKGLRNPVKLRKMISELDEYWRQVYESSLYLMKKNKELLENCHKEKIEKEALLAKEQGNQTSGQEYRKVNKQLSVENRYLRKMLKTYLYPAIANEILQEERLLSGVDTQVTKAAMEDFAEEGLPPSFPQAVREDRKRLNREEGLLAQMWAQADEKP
ncbi:MAG: hypothetical protein ACRC3H_21740 [Lachnospiraceae bacterium]